MSLMHKFYTCAVTTPPQGFAQKFWNVANNLGFSTQAQRDEKLQQAALKGDLLGVTFWHMAGADLGANRGCAARSAIFSGSEECVDYIFSRHVSWPRFSLEPIYRNFPVSECYTMVAIAAGRGHTHLIDRALDGSAGARDDELPQALLFAVDQGKLDTAKNIAPRLLSLIARNYEGLACNHLDYPGHWWGEIKNWFDVNEERGEFNKDDHVALWKKAHAPEMQEFLQQFISEATQMFEQTARSIHERSMAERFSYERRSRGLY